MPSPRPAVARCKRTCHETPEHRLHLRQRTNRPLRDRTQAQDGGLHKAACRDHDPELWFSGKPYEQAAALAICRSCPVIGECRRFADEHNRINGYQLQGIWGGRRYGVK